MTPAESKTIRESWGLSVQGLAEIMDVDPRSVTAWEAGRIEVDSQLSCLEDMAKRAVAVYAEQAAEDGTVTLVRYRTDEDLWRFHPELGSTPAIMHAALMERVYRTLITRDIPVIIQFMDPAAYLAWLGGRPDTEEEREAWAATLPRQPSPPCVGGESGPGKRNEGKKRMIIGTFMLKDDGTLEGQIEVAFGRAELCFRPNPAYVTDGGWPTPAFYIFAKETQGAAWLQNTREKNGGEEVTVISASFDDPFLPAALSFMLWPRKDAPGCYDAVWRRPAAVKKPKHGFEIGGKQGFRR